MNAALNVKSVQDELAAAQEGIKSKGETAKSGIESTVYSANQKAIIRKYVKGAVIAALGTVGLRQIPGVKQAIQYLTGM